jgi:hypothetical protein
MVWNRNSSSHYDRHHLQIAALWRWTQIQRIMLNAKTVGLGYLKERCHSTSGFVLGIMFDVHGGVEPYSRKAAKNWIVTGIATSAITAA